MVAEFSPAIDPVSAILLAAITAVAVSVAVNTARALAILLWEGFVSIIKRRVREPDPGDPSKRR